LFSYSNESENIWKIIVEQAKRKYDLMVSKEDIITGYLLSAIISRNGLICDFKKSSFDKSSDFFVGENNIPRDLFKGFRIKSRRYDMSNIS
jgi:hypothetical protein